MIEAVSSSLVSAQALRGNVGNVDASRAAAIAPPVTTSPAPEAPKAPYISPYIAIDVAHNKAVLQIRDRDTGDVQAQFPTESRLVQLSQAQARLEQKQAVQTAHVPDAPQPRQDAPQAAPVPSVQAAVITVQDVTSSSSANVSLPSPQIAAAALSAGAQSAQPSSAGVSVLA